MSETNEPSQSDLHEAAKELGEAGGKKGGPARARALSTAERSKIAKAAAVARWKKAAARRKKKSQQTKAKSKTPKIKKKKK